MALFAFLLLLLVAEATEYGGVARRIECPIEKSELFRLNPVWNKYKNLKEGFNNDALRKKWMPKVIEKGALMGAVMPVRGILEMRCSELRSRSAIKSALNGKLNMESMNRLMPWSNAELTGFLVDEIADTIYDSMDRAIQQADSETNFIQWLPFKNALKLYKTSSKEIQHHASFLVLNGELQVTQEKAELWSPHSNGLVMREKADLWPANSDRVAFDLKLIVKILIADEDKLQKADESKQLQLELENIDFFD